LTIEKIQHENYRTADTQIYSGILLLTSVVWQ